MSPSSTGALWHHSHQSQSSHSISHVHLVKRDWHLHHFLPPGCTRRTLFRARSALCLGVDFPFKGKRRDVHYHLSMKMLSGASRTKPDTRSNKDIYTALCPLYQLWCGKDAINTMHRRKVGHCETSIFLLKFIVLCKPMMISTRACLRYRCTSLQQWPEIAPSRAVMQAQRQRGDSEGLVHPALCQPVKLP
jgi:hypothetical protein